MRAGQATGFQVVVLMFAVMLLSVPTADTILKVGGAAEPWKSFVEKGTQFLLAILVIFAFPRLRRFALEELTRWVPKHRRIEVAFVAAAKLSLAFASTAALATWIWLSDGPSGVDRMRVDIPAEQSNAFSAVGLTRMALATLVAPFVEELVCRGFLYRAFERQWGWLASMLLTSTVFGLYHPHFWSAFSGSIVYVCLLRRTGTLWAPIIVHATFNLMLWWPLLGQHVFPHGVPLAAAWTWRFHLGCLAFAAIALPIYVWMSRDRHAVSPTAILDPNAPVPK